MAFRAYEIGVAQWTLFPSSRTCFSLTQLPFIFYFLLIFLIGAQMTLPPRRLLTSLFLLCASPAFFLFSYLVPIVWSLSPPFTQQMVCEDQKHITQDRACCMILANISWVKEDNSLLKDVCPLAGMAIHRPTASSPKATSLLRTQNLDVTFQISAPWDT